MYDCLLMQSGAEIRSMLDFFMGHHQIKAKKEIQKYLGFVCKFGAYMFTVMPMGATNSQQTFCRLMDKVFKDLVGKFISLYIDDTTIFSKTDLDHIKHIDITLKRIIQHKLKLNPKKCYFGYREVLSLGWIADAKGIRPDPSRVEKILKFKSPKNTMDIRKFMGMVHQYGRAIQSLEQIAAPLSNLLRKGTLFNWTLDCENAFRLILDKIAARTLLVYPKWDKIFHVYTDASSEGWGGVLTQEQDDGQELPICFVSAKFAQEHKEKYSIPEKELLATVSVIDKLEYYLLRRKFVLFTDSAITAAMLRKIHLHPAAQRLAYRLTLYDCEIQHLPGNKNIIADICSRFPRDIDPEFQTEHDKDENFIAHIVNDQKLTDLYLVTLDSVPEGRRIVGYNPTIEVFGGDLESWSDALKKDVLLYNPTIMDE